MHDDPAYMQAALRAGASGHIVKMAADVELLIAIRVIYHGRNRDEVPIGFRESAPPGRRRPLSARESKVLRLLV